MTGPEKIHANLKIAWWQKENSEISFPDIPSEGKIFDTFYQKIALNQVRLSVDSVHQKVASFSPVTPVWLM